MVMWFVFSAPDDEALCYVIRHFSAPIWEVLYTRVPDPIFLDFPRWAARRPPVAVRRVPRGALFGAVSHRHCGGIAPALHADCTVDVHDIVGAVTANMAATPQQDLPNPPRQHNVRTSLPIRGVRWAPALAEFSDPNGDHT
ncbi:hypothetical protein MMAR_2326 [Mycobacterium marinum M]|uniref:Uncharacterized protein n=1 Tax=Mycobacterium marinum (strain ATCC BAA-535 / M) TaxID=216594 RepID=B2HQ32_MYCMM|nr:hypothetical protein MMAR_2326 [Mycobacterium marinum M]GJO19618.1 hypothetical protein NJB1507_13670 [Mycobacterium marinum]